MAHRQPIWRLRGALATYLALRADRSSIAASLTRDQRVTCNGRYQPLRDSVSRCADEHATVLVPGHRHDTFRP